VPETFLHTTFSFKQDKDINMANKTNLKFLIADDVSIMRDLLKGMLRQGIDNIEIIEAANGIEAISLYKKNRPDIVFLDINMPGKNGIEVLEEIKTTGHSAFVIMVSAESTMENFRASSDAGSKGFVVKPYNMKKINDLLDTYHQEYALH